MTYSTQKPLHNVATAKSFSDVYEILGEQDAGGYRPVRRPNNSGELADTVRACRDASTNAAVLLDTVSRTATIAYAPINVFHQGECGAVDHKMESHSGDLDIDCVPPVYGKI